VKQESNYLQNHYPSIAKLLGDFIYAFKLDVPKVAKDLSTMKEDTNARAIGLYRRWGSIVFETRPCLAYGCRTGLSPWIISRKNL
jgi:hypothetical protein